MTTQNELQSHSTLRSGEGYTPVLAEISGPEPVGRSDAAPLINNMLNDYLEVMEMHDSISEEPDTTHPELDFFQKEKRGELAVFLELRKAEIIEYIVTSIDDGSLFIDPALFEGEARSLTSYAEQYTKHNLYTVRKQLEKDTKVAGITKEATSAFEPIAVLNQGWHPRHVTYEAASPEDKETIYTFADVVKGGMKMSARAISALKNAAMIRSGEITLPAGEGRHDDLDLLDDPEHAAEITQAIRLIKHKDLR